MRRATIVIPTALLLLGALEVGGQTRASVRTAFIAESYKFEEGFTYDRLSQYSIPFGLDFDFGQRIHLAVSTGWVNVDLKSQDTGALPHQQLSGLIDTEARLTVDVIPSRFAVILAGGVPTGIQTVAQEELAALGAISSDIIGLTTNELGNGGVAGVGFVGALPLGRFALGYGATFRTAFKYQPVLDNPAELKPGNEVRLRLGFEGPVARRSYLRFAGILATRQEDAIDGELQNGVGNRLVGYLSFSQGIGSSSLTLYGFDVYRAEPQIGGTVVGTQPLPKGNLFAAGARWEFPLGSSSTIAPRAEVRASDQAPIDDPNGSLSKAGRSLRGGIDFRYQVSRQFSLVLQGDGFGGMLVQDGEYGITGYRAGLHLEWHP